LRFMTGPEGALAPDVRPSSDPSILSDRSLT
jgi:hypothetical protein